jgi:hypothetical protein
MSLLHRLALDLGADSARPSWEGVAACLVIGGWMLLVWLGMVVAG